MDMKMIMKRQALRNVVAAAKELAAAIELSAAVDPARSDEESEHACIRECETTLGAAVKKYPGALQMIGLEPTKSA